MLGDRAPPGARRGDHDRYLRCGLEPVGESALEAASQAAAGAGSDQDHVGGFLGGDLGKQCVGDTPYDIAAAHAAGAIGIGVASGHSSKQELYGAGADYVLGSLLEELPGGAGPLS